MRISDWSSDVCSSDLLTPLGRQILLLTALEGFSVEEAGLITGTDQPTVETLLADAVGELDREARTSVLIIEDEPLIAMELEQIVRDLGHRVAGIRSEEHTSELQSLMRISYAVFCLKKKKQQTI